MESETRTLSRQTLGWLSREQLLTYIINLLSIKADVVKYIYLELDVFAEIKKNYVQ